MISEKRICGKILKWLNAQPETRAIKIHGDQYLINEPDIIGCRDGRFFAIEVKRPGKATRVGQKAIHRLWRRAGGNVIVATSLTEAQNWWAEWIAEE